MDLEFYLSVLSHYQLSSEKPTKTQSPMQNMFANHTPLTPHAWFDTVEQHDPEQCYIITELSLHKEWSVFHGQHEYILLMTQPCPTQTTQTTDEEIAPVAIRISRTITRNTLLGGLGLWGPANDTVTVLGTIQTGHDRLCQLVWEPQQAPTLRHMSHLIASISNHIPDYHLLKSSCYVFVSVILEAANLAFNGTGQAQQAHCLVRETHFLWYIPAGAKTVQDVARSVIRDQLWATRLQSRYQIDIP